MILDLACEERCFKYRVRQCRCNIMDVLNSTGGKYSLILLQVIGLASNYGLVTEERLNLNFMPYNINFGTLQGHELRVGGLDIALTHYTPLLRNGIMQADCFGQMISYKRGQHLAQIMNLIKNTTKLPDACEV